MLLQLTYLQRSHENLVLILILLKPFWDVGDSSVALPPSLSLRKAAWNSPHHPCPALLLSHTMPLHTHTEHRQRRHGHHHETASWGCSCTATAAIANVMSHTSSARLLMLSMQPSRIPVGSKKKMHYGARSGCRSPSVSSPLCHTLLKMSFFLRLSSSSLK